MDTITGKAEPRVLEYLLRRRSAKVDDLHAPGPDGAQIETILRAATRVPDHGKMCPWYYLVFEGDARAQAGAVLADAYKAECPNATADQIARERGRFLRAPVVIALISRVRTGKKPIWEQILSSGAAGQNLSLAAHALGFGVQWVTEWYGYDARVKAAFGLDARDHVAGFFYIGSVDAHAPEDRERPDLVEIVTHWRTGEAAAKGDVYNRDECGLPEVGFDVGGQV